MDTLAMHDATIGMEYVEPSGLLFFPSEDELLTEYEKNEPKRNRRQNFTDEVKVDTEAFFGTTTNTQWSLFVGFDDWAVYSITQKQKNFICPALEKLESVYHLPDNWDSYDSPALSDELYENAKTFLNSIKALDVPELAVVPVSGGGVQFEWQHGGRELEIEFSLSDKVEYLKVFENEFKNEEMEEGDFLPQDAATGRNLLRWLIGV